MHNVSDDAISGLDNHVAPYRATLDELIRKYKSMLNHHAKQLMPDNMSHTGDSGTYH